MCSHKRSLLLHGMYSGTHNMLWIRIDFVEVMFMENRLIQAGRRVLQLETHLEMHSDREIFIENCRRILEYNDIRIALQTTDLVLEIWGSELQTDSRSPESLRIHGKIQSITLTPKGARNGTASAGRV